MKKIWHISDTHCKHEKLKIPKNIDILIHSGDGSNNKNSVINYNELHECLSWIESLDIPYKIYSPGNHDTSMEDGLINKSEYPTVHIPIHELVEIEQLRIFCSPYTPTFYNWAYNKSRNKLYQIWESIPECDILVTHGPPKGILDITLDNNKLINVGCKSLMNKVLELNPKFHLFGHIHNERGVYNFGKKIITEGNTTFCNGAVVDLQYNLIKNGLIINYAKTS